MRRLLLLLAVSLVAVLIVTLDSGESRMIAKYKVPLTTLLKLR